MCIKSDNKCIWEALEEGIKLANVELAIQQLGALPLVFPEG